VLTVSFALPSQNSSHPATSFCTPLTGHKDFEESIIAVNSINVNFFSFSKSYAFIVFSREYL
jgi:hypothetical protein